MESKIDITSLKSAEVIDDPVKVAEALTRADQEAKAENPQEAQRPSTTVERDADGRARVHKEIGTLDSVTAVPDPEELRRLAEAVGVEWRAGYEERVVPYWASDERVDRHGDIVRQRWVFDNFSMNPVVPYSHNWDAPPIGNTIRWQVANRSDDAYSGPALHLLNLFAPADVWAFADTIYRLVRSGFLKASSVGFYPQIVIDVKDEKEREELGLGRWGYILDMNELMEHSPTTIPANVGAVSLLRSAKSKGMLQPHDIQAIRDMDRQSIKRGEGDLTQWRKRDASWLTIWNSLYPDVSLERHNELDTPITLDTSPSQMQDLCQQVRELGERLSGVEKMGITVNDVNATVADIRDLVEELTSKNNAPTGEQKAGTSYPALEGVEPELVRAVENAASALRAGS